MTPELKASWLADLKSGKYPKTQNYLKTAHGYCCLGVLCETAGIGFSDEAQGSDIRWYVPNHVDYNDINSGNELSAFGMDQFGLTHDQHDKLTSINDRTDGFDEVIKYIEENL